MNNVNIVMTTYTNYTNNYNDATIINTVTNEPYMIRTAQDINNLLTSRSFLTIRCKDEIVLLNIKYLVSITIKEDKG